MGPAVYGYTKLPTTKVKIEVSMESNPYIYMIYIILNMLVDVYSKCMSIYHMYLFDMYWIP